MLVLALPSHKMWGHFRVLRDRRNTLAVCQCKRVVFSWQAQHFVMWPFAMSWQAQHFVTWRRRCCFHESQWQWRANVTLLQISWQAQDLVIVLKSGGSFAKVILFELCKNGFIRKTRTKSSIFELKVWNLKEVSHEMLVLTLQTFKVRGHFRVLRGRRKTLEAPWLKSWGSLARNARFGSLFLEKLRKPRTKCSFWKLVPWKVAEASHEMLVLEACRLKSCEVSHEILVLEACSLKSWGSLARNARFGSLFLEKLRKPRTKCSFWKLLYYFVVRSSTALSIGYWLGSILVFQYWFWPEINILYWKYQYPKSKIFYMFWETKINIENQYFLT